MNTSDYVVIGGGAIGLSVAFSLSLAGASVTVLDYLEPGQASSASAGMLAPLGESRKSSPFVPLAVEALKRWPAFVERLLSETSTPLKINGPGMLRVALNDEEEAELIETFEWQQTFGLPLKLLCPHELADIEPGLSKAVVRAILTPMELHVEPRLLLSALNNACKQRGVTVLTDLKVTGFETSESKVTGISTTDGSIYGGKYIVSAGAWSTPLLAQLKYKIPVKPVRGQIVSYAPITPRPLKYTLYSHLGYLVPRPDGTLLAGATMEDAGFDSSNTGDGIASLTKMASSLVPSLSGVTDHVSWAGLRPICDDGMALLGDVLGWENLVISTGHGRNGILLAPYTGELIADYLIHDKPIPAIFDPSRFGQSN